MVAAARYSADDRLRDGRRLQVRALRSDDRAAFLSAILRTSPGTRYRRFFMAKPRFSDVEIDSYLKVDFKTQVALVALVDLEGQPAIVGGARYIVVSEGKAEVAFAVVDEFQGQGVGAALLRHLTRVARDQGVQVFVADVLPENTPMLRVFERSGLVIDIRRAPDGAHVELRL